MAGALRAAQAVSGVVIVVCWAITMEKVAGQVDRGQFADTVGGTVAYVLAFAVQLVSTPPLSYAALGVVALLGVTAAVLLVTDWLDEDLTEYGD
jgi:hypothetical protein